MDLLIPASGYATRMNKIPKFLLPGNKLGTSLLEIHVSLAGSFYENIYIATREELIPLLNEKDLGRDVKIIPMETSTMTETILELTRISEADSFAMIMPDTYFLGENPHSFLSSGNGELKLALWEIQERQKGKLGQIKLDGTKATASSDKDANCPFPYSWGALSFGKNFCSLLDSRMPHIGYGIPESIRLNQNNECIVVDGVYYDCGTPSEYFEVIKKVSN